MFLDAPPDIFTNGTAFLLGKRCQDGHHKLAVPAHGMDILFFKPDFDAQLFQMPDGTQKVYGVACEALDGLGQDDVYLPGFGIFQHPQEFLPLLHPRPRDAIVGIDPGVFPVRVLLDEAAVITDLRRKGMVHPLRFHGYAGIGCDFLSLLQIWYASFNLTDSPHRISSFRHYISLCLIQLSSV